IMVEHARLSPLWVVAYVALGFTPWALATPLFLRLSRRFMIARDARFALVHALIGLVATPVLVGGGLLLGSAVLSAADLVPWPFTASRILGSTLITALYSVPTYIALVAVAQGLAFLEFYRTRERLLARAQLRALQAQLNPHFLFNTLNAISA